LGKIFNFKNMHRIIRLTILIVVFGISAYFTFTVRFIRTGSIVEIRKDEIVVRGEGMHEPDYVLPIEEKSRFYDSRGNSITFSELKKITV